MGEGELRRRWLAVSVFRWAFCQSGWNCNVDADDGTRVFSFLDWSDFRTRCVDVPSADVRVSYRLRRGDFWLDARCERRKRAVGKIRSDGWVVE